MLKKIAYELFIFAFFYPSVCHAYLDPGTGNVLVYLVVSLVGAAGFVIKDLFYSLLGKNRKLEQNDGLSENDIVIFSEGKSYWNTFKPIVESLLLKQQKFSYYTMDVEDPCLTIDAEQMNNKYIGNGNVAFAKIGNIDAKLLLSTTPNIGTKGFPIPKSSKIKKLIHVFHAFDDLTCYHRGSLDHYDVVMLVGGFEEPIIRKLEGIRNLPAKELYPAGLPYLDVMVQQVGEESNYHSNINKQITVLIAPSWGSKGCLQEYGYKFIELLAETNMNIIIRPHPQSLKVEKELIDDIELNLKRYDNIVWDYAVDGTESMKRADVLISDTSSVRMDFILLYQKPIITLQMPMQEMKEFEMVDLKESWKEKKLADLGYFLSKNRIDEIPVVIREVLNAAKSDDIANFKRDNIYNWGHAGEVVADYLILQTTKNDVVGAKKND